MKNIIIKKGFTFAELMVSLVVIAVITAILYPTISELSPNNNKHLFKSAYKTTELVVSDIATASPDGRVPTGEEALCKEFEKRLNVQNEECNNKKLTTSNGMRWFFDSAGCASCCNLIIDVNAANNKIGSKKLAGAGTDIDPDDYWDSGAFIGNEITTDTFKIIIYSTGKVSATSRGADHLLEKTRD